MKTISVLLIFTFITVTAFGQERLGLSFSDIKSEFMEARYGQEIGKAKDGNSYISLSGDVATVIYYFDAAKICIVTAIIPHEKGLLNSLVKSYNDEYVVVSDTEWKMYSKNGVMKISLEFPGGDGEAYFLWMK